MAFDDGDQPDHRRSPRAAARSCCAAASSSRRRRLHAPEQDLVALLVGLAPAAPDPGRPATSRRPPRSSRGCIARRASSESRKVRGAARDPARRPDRHLASAAREHPVLRPSARPLRVLAARRRLQDRGAGRARRGVRPARARPHRPRRHERRGRALQGRQEGTASSRSSAARSTTSTTTRTRRRASERNHLTLLAESDEGYRNLVKLSSLGLPRGPQPRQADARHGPARRPRRAAIIALTGCLASRFASRITDGDEAGARAHADELLRPSGTRTSSSRSRRTASPSRTRSTRSRSRIAREVGRPLVGTGDVHYLRREDYHHHTALLCVQTKSTLADAEDDASTTNEFFLKDNGRDGDGLRRLAGGARSRRWTSPSAATSRSSSASS